ncbi:MAG TPA: methionine--tRNA ligase subunit beta, partial [Acidobacteriaceae bacterium]|nr:methionine--tRNA ligase subunit beta [Acidobacteriaceae bacterium]
KMSKSKGNIVRTETILEAFGEHVYAKQFPDSTKRERDLFAADVLRYFLLREIPFGQDGSFSFDAMVTRYNADLANGYGNLVSRTLSMIDKYFGGAIPMPVFEESDESTITADGFDASLLGRAGTALQARLAALSETEFTTALAEIASFVTVTDGFITANAPWKLAKDPERAGRLATVLYLAAEAVRWVTAALHTTCPQITIKVWQQLGLGSIDAAIRDGELAAMHWGGLKPGTKLGPLAPIFPRADKGLAQIMIDMEENNSTTRTQTESPESSHAAAAPRNSALDEPSGTLAGGGTSAEKPTLPITPNPPGGAPALVPPTEESVKPGPIGIDDFAKIELRVAQIVVAERIPKADKLLRLEVDLGYEKRQILSGIAEWYTPEELIGRRIVVITNLAPRKMRGLESHGMLLAASEGEGGKPVLATFGEEIALGSRLK